MSGSNQKNRLGFYVRFAVSLLLIYIVLRKAGLTQLWQTLYSANISYLFLSLIITPVLILISSWKWQVILRAQDIKVPLVRLLWLYAVGYFFNTVLPTNVGGDIARASSLARQTGKSAEVFSSVFIERFTGLTVLLLMAILAFFAAIRDFWNVFINLALITAIVGYFALFLIVLNSAIFEWIESRVKLELLRNVLGKFRKFQRATSDFRFKKSALFFAMANSLLFYFAGALNVFVSALVFNSELSLLDALIITPIVLVITMIPISIGGIGLSEGAYFFAFNSLGLIGTVGLSVAMLMRLKALIAGLIGGMYFLATGKRNWNRPT